MAENTLHFTSAGILLGLSAGLTPGPLLTLVLTQSIKHNQTEGIKVAVSPLITDLPIILLTVFIFHQLSELDGFLALISFAGGAFIAYLGMESLRVKKPDFVLQQAKTQSLKKGIIANFLNPSPYIFWTTVGTPLLFEAFQISLTNAVLFLFSFYGLLLGSKIAVAVLAARSKFLMNQKSYLIVMRVLGIALLLFSILFFYDGVKYL